MMKQSGHHLSLLLVSTSTFLQPDHRPARPPRAPNLAMAFAGLGVPVQATMTDINDIYEPINRTGHNPYLVSAAVALGILILALLLLRTRQRRSAAPAESVSCNIFNNEIKYINDQIGQNNTRHYAEHLAATLRRYIEQQCNIPATRLTTVELARQLRDAADEGSGRPPSPLYRHVDQVRYCLQQCDLIKFAGFVPEDSIIRRLDSTIRTLSHTIRNEHEPGG